MSLPILLTSDMLGAPNLTPTNGSLNALLHACLVNGFNTQSVVSATASGGVVTFNFASAPGFSALSTVTVAGSTGAVADGKFRVQSAASNQVLVAIPGVPDGAVGGTITLKFSPLGWTRPYSGSGIGCYQQGGGSATKRFMRVYDTNVAAAGYQGFVRGYENMTAVSTGTGPFPTTAQAAGNGSVLYLPTDSTSDLPAQQYRSWVVIGTPRFFVIYWEAGRVMYGSTDAKNTVAATVSSAVSGFAFGELANITKPADAFAHLCSGTEPTTQYVPRSAAGTGSAVRVQIGGGGYTASGFSHGAVYPSASDGGLHSPGPAILSEVDTPYTLRGTMPGVLTLFEAPFSNATTPPALGMELTGMQGVTGRLKLMRNAYTSYGDAGWLLDEDWGDV